MSARPAVRDTDMLFVHSTQPSELATEPAVFASDLPACLGDCSQGRVCCPHPLVCAGIDGARRSTAADVAERADVKRAQRVLVWQRRITEGAWWVATGLLLALAYALAKN